MSRIELQDRILEMLPEDGSAICNKKLCDDFGAGISEAELEQAKADLVARGLALGAITPQQKLAMAA